jgi:hypothetical protein
LTQPSSTLLITFPGGAGVAQAGRALGPGVHPFILFTTHADRLPPRLATAAADPLAFIMKIRSWEQWEVWRPRGADCPSSVMENNRKMPH